jgi:hypothetical protein
LFVISALAPEAHGTGQAIACPARPPTAALCVVCGAADSAGPKGTENASGIAIRILNWGNPMRLSRAVLLACFAALGGCDSGKSSREQAAAAPRIFETQRSALDKAKAVQDTLDQAGRQQRAEEEAQTR